MVMDMQWSERISHSRGMPNALGPRPLDPNREVPAAHSDDSNGNDDQKDDQKDDHDGNDGCRRNQCDLGVGGEW